MSMPKPVMEMLVEAGRKRGVATPAHHHAVEELRRRGADAADPDLNEYSKAILKNSWLDNRFFLLTVAKRIQHSMPLHKEEVEAPAGGAAACGDP